MHDLARPHTPLPQQIIDTTATARQTPLPLHLAHRRMTIQEEVYQLVLL